MLQILPLLWSLRGIVGDLYIYLWWHHSFELKDSRETRRLKSQENILTSTFFNQSCCSWSPSYVLVWCISNWIAFPFSRHRYVRLITEIFVLALEQQRFFYEFFYPEDIHGLNRSLCWEEYLCRVFIRRPPLWPNAQTNGTPRAASRGVPPPLLPFICGISGTGRGGYI